MNKIELDYMDLYKILSELYFEQKNENPLCLHDFCEIQFNKYQPDSSKREDDIMYLWCGICDDYYHILLDQNHIDRCGARNSMET